MQRKFSSVFFLVLFALLLAGQGRAAESPVHFFDCKECHLSSLTITELGGNNVCLKCHDMLAGDVTLGAGAPPALDGHTDGRFSVGDASNAFGHGSGQPGAYQTSHTWAAPSDTQPAAGALPPLRSLHPEFFSRYGTSVGRLTCSRCHNPHASVENNPKLLVKGNASADTMCRACHRSWVLNNRGWLTHPIVDDYNASVAANPGKYRATLSNQRNADIRLVAGGVSCTSCHGAHFVDSSATTADGPGQALNPADGKLLRGDGPGQADKSSLCQSCHSYSSHGGRGEQVGCLVCHSGHSYDPAAPNYFVLRKAAATTAFGAVTGLDFSSPDVLLDGEKYKFWNDRIDGSAGGYCEKCHGDAGGIGLGAGSYHVASAVCTNCHRHGNEVGAFSANCGDCHGNSVSQASWPDSLANNSQPAYAWADDAGSHAVHVAAIGTGNLSCAACHPGNPPVDHYLDDSTGVQQAEVTRMDTNGDGVIDYWQYAEGATATSGPPVYLQTAAIADDVNAYYRTTNKTCYNISCHGNVDLAWGATGCLACHGVEQGARAAIVGQFAASSHHIQGATLTAAHCYQCHWEAKSDGSVNPAYHGGAFQPGAAVDLVIYGAGARPATHTDGVSAVRYTADGTRTEIAKINQHCLGCHSEQNSTTQPFGDGKTPQEYAWDKNEGGDVDGTSIAARYSQTGTTTFGKYTTTTYAAKKIQTKAYSAHGKAILNEGGWSTATGVDETLLNSRSGAVNVACFDCHNSHGSPASGVTTSYNSATSSGGLLKATVAGRGGYSVDYQPTAGGAAGTSNTRNAGASLCFDCHLNASGASSFPWGYQATFGTSQKIIGYYDSPYFAPGNAGPKVRYPYKAANDYQGGHFGASSPLTGTVMGSIDGLCTPCHDPHGVSPVLGTDQQYGIPLLKGTWLTSPYKEDAAPASPLQQFSSSYRPFFIDQNTFGLNLNTLVAGITQTEQQFAGLCLKCHPKTSLTGATRSWMSKDRIHESVKGWKPSGTVKHRYSCSKCHSPHMGSVLPRLMVTNCLDPFQKGRGTATNRIEVFGEGWENRGQFPKNTLVTTCHEANLGNAYKGLDQRWNNVTPFNDDPAPVITAGPTFTNRSWHENYLGVDYWYFDAGINWSTNAMTYSMVEYGPTTSYGMTYIGDMATAASGDRVYITGLANHTTYHYRVHSKNNMGQEVVSGDYTFRINVAPMAPTLSPEPDVITLDDTVAVLNWNASLDPDGGTVEYEIQLDDNSDFSSPLASGSWTTALSYTTPALPTGKTWYWRVRARDAGHTDAVSGWSTVNFFKTYVPPPSVPTLIDTTDILGSNGTTVALDWNDSTVAIGGGTLEYYVQLSTAANFSTILYNSAWLTDTAWITPGLTSDTAYYWRTRARYDLSTPVQESAFSAADRFILTSGAAPVVTLIYPALNATIYSDAGSINLTFQWSSAPSASQYYVEVSKDNFATIESTSGWITSLSWTGSLSPIWGGTSSYSWRVKARAAVTGTETGWTTSSLIIVDSGSCPFLFVWDGTKYVFEADLYGAGKLALKTKSGYVKPEPNDYYILKTTPALKNGLYDFRLVEERYEANYMDELKLYALDVPDNRIVFAEKPQAGSSVPFTNLSDVLHTVSSTATAPTSVIHVNTGMDVTALVAANDDKHVVLNEDRNIDFTYQTLELDLGDIQLAPQVKIVMDAMSMFPNTAEGTARAATFGPRTKLEVQDADGNWVNVPATAGSLPKAPEFSRPYIFDISNIWISDSRRVRFTFLFKTYVDWILMDSTADSPVTITEVPIVSADLRLHGIDPKSADTELYEYVYSEPNGATAYFPGSYTRFGEVMSLLSRTDDKFVIYGGGDEIAMTFTPPAPPAPGINRSLLVYTNGYYKDVKVDVPHTIEPLPFAAMSNFPYDEADENYPNDAEHNAYRAEYNTRLIEP